MQGVATHLCAALGGVKPSPGHSSSWKMLASVLSPPILICGVSAGDAAPVQHPISALVQHPTMATLHSMVQPPARAGSRGQGIPLGRVNRRGAVPMPGWMSRFSLGGGQWWFMGKEKLAAGPDVPAFPLFLQPPERRSLFSFPDGQEESDGGNCHCLITAQGPLYDGRHGREQGSIPPHWRGEAR